MRPLCHALRFTEDYDSGACVVCRQMNVRGGVQHTMGNGQFGEREELL